LVRAGATRRRASSRMAASRPPRTWTTIEGQSERQKAHKLNGAHPFPPPRRRQRRSPICRRRTSRSWSARSTPLIIGADPVQPSAVVALATTISKSNDLEHPDEVTERSLASASSPVRY